jgi:hypothetical protein
VVSDGRTHNPKDDGPKYHVESEPSSLNCPSFLAL